MAMKSVLLISHGSRFERTKEEVQALVDRLKSQSRIEVFKFAFLELEQPSIPEGIGQCVAEGADEIIVLLNFLNSGRHVDEDIPRIVQEARQKYPSVKMTITPPVGQHVKIIDLFLDMIL
jgi:sirohydrochlorin ferrochelatase